MGKIIINETKDEMKLKKLKKAIALLKLVDAPIPDDMKEQFVELVKKTILEEE